MQILRSWENDKIIYISKGYFITFTWKSKYILYSVSRECYQAYQTICVTNTLNDWASQLNRPDVVTTFPWTPGAA